MIPAFDENGRLPVGIHVCTLKEFEDRFLNNQTRKVLYAGLKRLISDLRKLECEDLYIDGSFVTSEILPKDIDVCWGDERIDDPRYLQSLFEKLPHFFLYPSLHKKKYSCDVFPSYGYNVEKKLFYLDYFQRVKQTNVSKGIIKLKFNSHDKK